MTRQAIREYCCGAVRRYWASAISCTGAATPRAVVLLGLVRRAAPKSGQLAVAEAVLTTVRRKWLSEPNIDFAIATLARVAGMAVTDS